MFGAVKLTENVDIDLYKYSGYGIGFNRKGFFSIGDEVTRNVITSGVDMSLSAHIDNKKKDILILGKGPMQGLWNTMAAQKLYSINFNWANSYLLVKSSEIIKFKAKDSQTVAYPLCLGKILKDWSVNNM